MFGKRTSQTAQAKFRGEAATLSLTHCHWDRPLGRQSRALTTGLERATCGKLRCRGPFSSFLTNPFICFECYSNIEQINEGIISNAKHEQQTEFRKPLSRSANERISDGHMLRLAYGDARDANFRARCVSAWLPSYSAKERLDEYGGG